MKVLTFYLPQFHEIEENNKWWGKGFTEWTNTTNAKPFYPGHHQPRTPLGDNYYNLLEDGVLQWQASLAKENGIDGFCFYHYYFKDGKKLLEKPSNLLLKNRDIDLPFCFSWANEPWSRRWTGKEQEVLMPQDYGSREDWIEHFNYLLPFFQDDRYIRVDNKPVFLIYKPEDISELGEMHSCWTELAMQNGFDGLYLIATKRNSATKFKIPQIFNGYVRFEPFYSMSKVGNVSSFYKVSSNIIRKSILSMYEFLKMTLIFFGFGKKFALDYDKTWKQILKLDDLGDDEYPGAFVDWDNTARRGKKAIFFKGASPAKFGFYIKALKDKLDKKDYNGFIFINAWNEWAEGTYLEPDDKYKYQYLEELKKAIQSE